MTTCLVVPSHLDSHAQWHTHVSTDLDDVERVFVAALQESELDTADQLLALIEKRFPRATSRRVQLMHGLRHEAAGDYSAAMRVYDDVLKRDPACVVGRDAILRHSCVSV